MTRRQGLMLARTFALLLSAVLWASAGAAPAIRVTLLGTGCPPAVMNRFGPSTLVEAGGQAFLFDVGRGALQRLNQTGVRWGDVQGVFLTHLHSDHVVGFPDTWLTGWVIPGRFTPVRVWGPRGTRRMMEHLEQAFDYDIRVRLYDEQHPLDGVELQAEDIAEGVVYDSKGVRISAFEVDHAPVKPAFGYRVDYAGHAIVMSGDTRFSENLIRHAQGVDVLIHEVAAPETFVRARVPPEGARRVMAHHVTPEQAGEVFARTKPKLAVYSHIVLPGATPEDLVPPTRKFWAGPLEVGEDLMVIEVGDSVTVRRPAASAQPGSPADPR